MTGYYPLSIAIHPQSNSTVLVGTYYAGIFKSTNAGATWIQTANSPGINSISISRASPDLAYASADSFLYKSTDRGSTWQNIGSSIPGYEFRTILADPIQSTVAYVNNNFSIFRSTDQGTNWNEAHQGLAFAGIPVIAVAPSSPSIIYTEYRDKAVYKTTNAGQTWFQTSTFLSCGMICAIGVDHLNPDLVYAFEGVG